MWEQTNSKWGGQARAASAALLEPLLSEAKTDKRCLGWPQCLYKQALSSLFHEKHKTKQAYLFRNDAQAPKSTESWNKMVGMRASIFCY